MIRRALFEALLFLAPFALYGLYWRLVARDAQAPRRKHPWNVLFVSGLLLVTASFVILGLTEGDPAKGVYVPPHLEKGVVVPGRVDTGGAK